jgi:2-aminobenzoate-CoA ligase
MSAHVDTFVRDNLPPQDQWAEMTFALPELQFPAQYNASSVLDVAIANGHRTRPAVLLSSETITYDALLQEASRIAHVLTNEFGLVPGNRVLIHASNTRLSLPVWWGVFRAGGVAVGTMPMLRAHELAVILNKAQISHAIVDTHRAGELEAARPLAPVLKHIVTTDDLTRRMAKAPSGGAAVLTAADDPALIAFTSGTTGTPKGCVHFHRDIAAMAETVSRHILQPKPTDVFIGTPPFAFTFGLGAGMVFPKRRRRDGDLREARLRRPRRHDRAAQSHHAFHLAHWLSRANEARQSQARITPHLRLRRRAPTARHIGPMVRAHRHPHHRRHRLNRDDSHLRLRARR